jgi:hypothetical protein
MVIERILAHLNGKAPSVGAALLPENRAPPPQARLGDPVSSIESRNTLISVATHFEAWRAFYWLEAENWAESDEKPGRRG